MSELGRIIAPDQGSAEQTLVLAKIFHRSAEELIAEKRRDRPWAPYRLLVTHALELYLNAFLLKNGISQKTLKGMQHDFAKRGELVCALGLGLRPGTSAHLSALTERKEYVTARYVSYVRDRFSEPNRIQATLCDVSEKVEASFLVR